MLFVQLRIAIYIYIFKIESIYKSISNKKIKKKK